MQKILRLTKKSDFQETYHKGMASKNKFMVLIALKKENSGKTRVGYSLSKRLGTAVERNRTKRLLREVFKSKETKVKRGYDILIVARLPIKGKSFVETRDALVDVLKRAGLEEI
ncbi:MAG TPA: ribonuclease P protein component [Actinobacteria bacterium]|nr:ribonuclease P protein component [Actinomycetota bacterium]